MTRTTPPRPVDIAEVFAELREHTRLATRLHPRPGAPTVADSSIGGPLLWPADEPWPVCEQSTHDSERLLRPETVRQWRDILGAGWARTRRGESLALTDADRAALPDLGLSEPAARQRGPIAMVPVVQLYRRDVPGFLGPDDTDLLQVLWCPLDHDDLGYNPRLHLRWRRTAEVTEVVQAPPQPAVVNDDYLPEPCVLHPEQVREYDYLDLLPAPLAARIRDWDDHDLYFSALSVADGWKLGGFANWNLSDPEPVDCESCGTPMRLLLCAASAEWDGDRAWRPLEDAAESDFQSLHGPQAPTAVTIGRGYSLWVHYCPVSFDHPHRTAMQ
jgi:hypothetical protein